MSYAGLVVLLVLVLVIGFYGGHQIGFDDGKGKR